MARCVQYLLVLFITLILTTAAKNTACNKLPSFLSRLQNGVDITKLAFLPFDINNDDGFRNPIVSFTCDKKKTITINKIEYDSPDQLWNIANIPSNRLNMNVEIHKTSKSLKSSMARHAGVDLLQGFFSASEPYKKLQNYIENESKYVEDVTSYTSGYTVNIFPVWLLEMESIAEMFINRFLPNNLSNETLQEYFWFIKMFGTHYFQRGKFGGLFRLLLATNKGYYLYKKDSFAEAQARATFMAYLKEIGVVSWKTKSADPAFNSSTTENFRRYGSQTNMRSKNRKDFWKYIEPTDPWMIGGSLAKISDLIKNKIRRESMQRAIEIYMDLAYISELSRLVQWRYSDSKWYEQKSVMRSFATKLKNVSQTKMPLHEEVLTLGRETEVFIQTTVPDWFKKTKLCFNWYTTGNADQCDGSLAPPLCAEVNHMTTYYRDDTDRRSGACMMQWGIFPSGHDDWFSKVEIWFHSYPTGRGRGQCGDGTSKSIGANVGAYTSYYRDDTDWRWGGCRMQWMLKVPADAPLWMHRAKICFQWYATADGGQCGGGVSNYLCAKANTYTKAYQDDTDHRNGGCKMSWGIKIDE